MLQKRSNKHFFQGALILTLAGIVSKILSAGYRIPLQNITGDVGFYIYQQIYPFLGMAMMLSLYGLPTAISKLIAEKTEGGRKKLLTSDFYRIATVLFLFSIGVAVLLFVFAPNIAQIMGDLSLIIPLRTASFVFLVIPFVSSVRGLFQGYNNMIPTAFSQMVEQLIRVLLIIGFSLYVIQQSKPFYYIGIGGAVASLVGALGASLILFIFLKKEQVTFQQAGNATIRWSESVRSVLGFGLVITINHMLLLLFQFVDAFTLVSELKIYGYSLTDAKIWKGIFDRGQPLVQLGIVIGSSLALALIPTITMDRFKKQERQFISYIRSSWKFSLYLSTGAAVGLITLFPHVNELLFLSNSGTRTLQVLAFTIIFASLSITTASILQGFGYMYRTAWFVLIGVGFKLLLNILLVPLLGVLGGALATVIGAAVVLMVNIHRLKMVVQERIIDVPWIRLLSSIAGMVFILFLINQSIFPFIIQESRMLYAVYLLLAIVAGASVYVILLIKFRAFTKEELEVLPFQKIVRRIAKENNYGRKY
ncbi:putative polysaccharide biosynthesis protein [Paraliobacillus salinarum]|uniref:putative polysaccharide biosynthesis protein n=1 Tax=Paraliobacillus salinarum TaxID=1158996 RepID=UPI0015F48FF7|nr:polysaccharide biosynthesis protein [Paraliobacillus salinarum]